MVYLMRWLLCFVFVFVLLVGFAVGFEFELCLVIILLIGLFGVSCWVFGPVVMRCVAWECLLVRVGWFAVLVIWLVCITCMIGFIIGDV